MTVSVTTSTETTLFGATIPGEMSTVAVTGGGSIALAHSWAVDSTGLFEPVTASGAPVDLATEWAGLYERLLANDPTLTGIQRLEANAEAVFLNTGLNNLSAAQQQVDRADAQREFDAIGAAMQIDKIEYGFNPNAPLTAASYQTLETTLQGNAQLEELAIQGHGLNSPPSSKYDGFTNDFQNNVDNATLFIGGGLNNNQDAIAAFFDDNIMTHVPFPTVWQGGQLVQLNQNGDAENTLQQAVIAMDDSMFYRVYTAADFSKTASTVNDNYVSPAQKLVIASENPVAPAGMETTLSSQFISTTLSTITDVYGISAAGAALTTTVTLAHTWIANQNGLYVLANSASDPLAAEWKADYLALLAGGASAAALNPLQRMEANAEAVFENTGMANLSASQQETDREDVQREFDVMYAAMQINQKTLGISTTALFTDATYLALEHTLQSNASLEQLGIQGHGLNNPPKGSNGEYQGYTNDFQNNVDQVTLYVGGGLDTGDKALADLFDDAVITHVPFAVVAQNGNLEQLNQNGTADYSLSDAVSGINQTMFQLVYHSTDFLVPTTAPAGDITTFSGDVIGNTISSFTMADGTVVQTQYIWEANGEGLFRAIDRVTGQAENLQAQWEGYYKALQQGGAAAAALTPIERLEANAEAVFDNTGLASVSAANGELYREDLAREFDAMWVGMQMDADVDHISPTALFTEQSYLDLENTIQNNPVLEELAIQGHGLNNPTSARYNGFTTDFQNTVDNSTLYIGGGLNNNEDAIADFLDDNVLTHVPFPAVEINGTMIQLNQNGDGENTLKNAIVALDDSMFERVYTAADFSKTAVADPAKYISAAEATVDASFAVKAGAGQEVTFNGFLISTTLSSVTVDTGFDSTVNGSTLQDVSPNGVVPTGAPAADLVTVSLAHQWVANSSGLYVLANSAADPLAAEWKADYQALLAGGAAAAALNPEQRLEANAEAVFENTGLNSLSAAAQEADREDVQRVLEAEWAAMQINAKVLKISDTVPFTDSSYQEMERTLQSTPALEQLAVQGFGLTDPPSAEYAGFINGFANVDSTTLYVGGGLNSGEDAVSDFLAENILSDVAFPTVIHNGHLVQLNQNAGKVSQMPLAVATLDDSAFWRVYKASDFKHS